MKAFAGSRAIAGAVIVGLTWVGCALVGEREADVRVRLRPLRGLERVAFPMSGSLEVRRRHNIGSYDMLRVPDPRISYERGSLELTPPAERAFLGHLKQSLIEAIEAANIPVVIEPGPCTMDVVLRVSRMKVDYGKGDDDLAVMTIVMQFNDSTSGFPLLRYATDKMVPNPTPGVTRDEKMRAGLNRVIAELDIGAGFRHAGLGDNTILPGCKGTLAARGRAAADAQ